MMADYRKGDYYLKGLLIDEEKPGDNDLVGIEQGPRCDDEKKM